MNIIIHLLSAEEIKGRNIHRIVLEVERRLARWETEKTLQLIQFGISGYDNDLRALFDIPEVRAWASLLHARLPFILLALEVRTLHWFFPCVADIEVVDRSPNLIKWRMKEERVQPFLQSLLEAGHRFFGKLTSNQEDYDKLVAESLERLKTVMPLR